jgi:hypothetical protein
MITQRSVVQIHPRNHENAVAERQWPSPCHGTGGGFSPLVPRHFLEELSAVTTKPPTTILLHCCTHPHGPQEFIDERRKFFQTHWDRRPHLLIRVSVAAGCTTRRSATRKTVHLRRGRRNSVARNPRRNEYRNLAECCQLWSSASDEQRCKGIP